MMGIVTEVYSWLAYPGKSKGRRLTLLTMIYLFTLLMTEKREEISSP